MSEEIAKQNPQQELIANTNKKFEALQTQSLALTSQCKSIKVSDTTTLAMAEQTLSKSNQLYKMIEDKRVAIKAPYLAAGKAIDAIANSLLKDLDSGIAFGKEQLDKWNKEQAELKKKEDEANEKLVAKLTAIRDQLQQKTELCKTPDQCQNLIDSINKIFPPKESFKQYGEDAMVIKNNFVRLLAVRKMALSASLTGNVGAVVAGMDEAAKVEEAIATAAEVIDDKKNTTEQSNTFAKSNTRKVWAFEVVDLLNIPRSMLILDEKAVRHHMKTQKQQDGSITPIEGIRFFQEENVVIK